MLEGNTRSRAMKGSKSLTLRDLAPLFRHKRALIVVFLFVFALAASLGLRSWHKYESHMVLLVTREPLDPVIPTEAATQIGPAPALTDREVNSDAELLKTSDLLEQVVLGNGMQNAHGNDFLNFLPRQAREDRIARAVQALASQMQVEISPGTNLIKVTYSSSDPALAYGVLKSLGKFYLAKHAQIHRPPGSNQYLAQRAQNYKAALQDAEAGLRAFGRTPDVAELINERTEMAQQLTAAVAESHTIEQAIAADEQRIQSDLAQMRVSPQTAPVIQDRQNLLLQNLEASLLAAETARTQLLLKNGPNDPPVREADQEVAQSKAAIAQAKQNTYVDQPTDGDPTFESLRENLAIDRADLETQKASLAAKQRGIQSMRSLMAEQVKKPLDEAELERESKARDESYSLYLSQREQEHTSGELDRTRTESVAIAVAPERPVRPAHGPALIFLSAFAVAVLVSLQAAYIIDYLDSSFHTPDYLDASFHTPAKVIEIPAPGVVLALPKRTATQALTLDYYQLREQPFGVTPDSRYLFLNATHREALAALLYGLDTRCGLLALIAEPGLGKTTLLFQTLSQLREKAVTAFLLQTVSTPMDLLQSLLAALGIQERPGSLIHLQLRLKEVLMEQSRRGKRVVVVIDEAQTLDNSVLELAHTLSSFETSGKKLVQIILAGQPQLAEEIASPGLEQLRQRVSIFARLQPFTREDTELYIDHRLRTAGYSSETPLFTPDALALITEYSEGIPRSINNLCFNALPLGCALRLKPIDRGVVDEVIAGLDVGRWRKRSPLPSMAKQSGLQGAPVFLSAASEPSPFVGGL
jgi:type II secretory pathway predicted ATPase ExeA/uncharacterized protein involved in exopolysaccharide biosynthesis